MVDHVLLNGTTVFDHGHHDHGQPWPNTMVDHGQILWSTMAIYHGQPWSKNVVPFNKTWLAMVYHGRP
ncbi:hypothetical protein DPMN_000196 [Dreissena polymorpha]|uniref:Uncharacterized protein n=1 Tax=Dreissena polymorpha TaxID=45954 RepID=A0A9D4MJ73_DREPO|nr:hypothetical protein DPMN_000196 [Dreissena polymorpha]